MFNSCRGRGSNAAKAATLLHQAGFLVGSLTGRADMDWGAAAKWLLRAVHARGNGKTDFAVAYDTDDGEDDFLVTTSDRHPRLSPMGGGTHLLP